MRIPPNLKNFLLSAVAIGVIVCACIYLPKWIPGIGDIATVIVILGMFILIVAIVGKSFITSLYARADGIFAIYDDVSETGMHVFSYHLSSGGEMSFNTRDIQHYFMKYDSGKRYMKVMFSHSMEPADGRSGWGEFRSFEESVLKSSALKKTMEILSKKSGVQLALKNEWKNYGEDSWTIYWKNRTITIKKYSSILDEGFLITCFDTVTHKTFWKKRI